MSQYQEIILDVTTNEITTRQYTNEEIAEVEAQKAKMLEQEQKFLEHSKQRAALLERLGITEEEAKLLLG